MSKCLCGSQIAYSSCCEPFIKGTKLPPTAEALMRSRYVAFTLADIDYIESTTDAASRAEFDRDGTLEWAKSSKWQSLEIVSTKDGGERDATGMVEFIAKFNYDGADREHHERSDFKKREGKWFFVDGKLVQAPARSEKTIGRNDPCTCGSGKKYKKCCGANVA